MKTIFYLIDLHEGKLIESYEGEDDKPPQEAVDEAEKRVKETGHGFALTRGKLFF